MASYICPALLNDIGYVPAELARSTGTITGSTIRQVAAAAIAIDNANRLVDNYKKQRDISDRVLKISEEQQAHLQNVFWPRDEQFLAEFSTPEAIEAVDTMGRRYAGRLVATIAGAFATKLRESKCNATRYCTSASTKALQDLLMARSAAMANARVLGRNIAFAEYQARSDTNLQRRMQAVAIGRDLMQQAATLYANAGEGLAKAGGILSGQLSSAMEAFKYERGRDREGRAAAYQTARDAMGSPKEVISQVTLKPEIIKADFGFKSSQHGINDPDANNVLSEHVSRVKGSDSGQFLNDQAESINSAAMGGG